MDALHRYSYTLKKFPKDPNELAVTPDNIKAVIEMKFNLLLNLARCHRKLEVFLILTVLFKFLITYKIILTRITNHLLIYVPKQSS